MSLYTKIIDLQKLNAAWKKVYRNKPAAGCDRVTAEDFNGNAAVELKQLNIELKEHRYQVNPVKNVILKNDGKERTVSLYCMRDKVVQASLAAELVGLYEPAFSPCAYAYRSDRSALTAIDRIEKEAASGKYSFALKTDIKSFFDTIDLNRLWEILSRRIKEEDVLKLIFDQLKAPALEKTGELIPRTTGVYQGSGISPVLSNVFLTDFDRQIASEDIFYIRYADDMLVLAGTVDRAREMQEQIRTSLSDLGLSLSEAKTCIRCINDGFEFLGYGFDRKGRKITEKAQEKLEVSLEDVWLSMRKVPLGERLAKGSRILTGWEQFFKGERRIGNIFEYTVLVYMTRNKEQSVQLAERRAEFVNGYLDIAGYLSEVWEEIGRMDLAVFEYEQFYGIAEKPAQIADADLSAEILSLFKEMKYGENEENITSLVQAYADAGLYSRSEKMMDLRKQAKDSPAALLTDPAGSVDEDESETGIRELSYLELFGGREDMYTLETVESSGRRHVEHMAAPLTADVIRKHLSGEETAGTYVMRNNNTVHYLVFDIDISRRFLLADSGNEALMKIHLQNVLGAAAGVQQEIKQLGMNSYVEFSGNRGYHVWLFFMEWIPAKYAFTLEEIILEKAEASGIPEDVTIEIFPAKSKRNSGSAGQRIKLPLGVHPVSRKRCFFVGRDGRRISAAGLISSPSRYTLENVKKVIGANTPELPVVSEKRGVKTAELDYEKLPELPDSVMIVLKGCSLMRYLVNKAVSTGYLTHFERQSVLYVFGHLGEDGKDFVHTVMSFTINYQYFITQKFIDRIPEKPVSCIKLRDQYKQVTAEYGCSCSFKRTRNCYPSPVIHALKGNEEKTTDITIPASRRTTEAAKEKAYDELNIHSLVETLTERLVELNKQKRGIDKSLRKVEKDLSTAFDNAGVDCMEVEMGMLVRRRKEGEYEWAIEM